MTPAATEIPSWLRTLAPAGVVAVIALALLALGALRKDRSMMGIAAFGLALCTLTAAVVYKRHQQESAWRSALRRIRQAPPGRPVPAAGAAATTAPSRPVADPVEEP